MSHRIDESRAQDSGYRYKCGNNQCDSANKWYLKPKNWTRSLGKQGELKKDIYVSGLGAL